MFTFLKNTSQNICKELSARQNRKQRGLEMRPRCFLFPVLMNRFDVPQNQTAQGSVITRLFLLECLALTSAVCRVNASAFGQNQKAAAVRLPRQKWVVLDFRNRSADCANPSPIRRVFGIQFGDCFGGDCCQFLAVNACVYVHLSRS
jgi:hypothetical protein